MTAGDKINVFQFMALRAPQTSERLRSSRDYIWDFGQLQGELGDRDGQTQVVRLIRGQRDAFRPDSDSAVGQLVYRHVFGGGAPKAINAAVVQGVRDQMVVLQPQLDAEPAENSTFDIVQRLEGRRYIVEDGKYYLLPTRLIDAPVDIAAWLPRLREILVRHAALVTFDKPALMSEVYRCIASAFDQPDGMHNAVYRVGEYDYVPMFRRAHGVLWDTFYQLYILRRIVDVDLSDLMDGIRALHILELLAVDACIAVIQESSAEPIDAESYLTVITGLFPEHATLRLPLPLVEPFEFVKSAADLKTCLEAAIVVPPIVAELGYYSQGKFNGITPFLGDLKVVKQWLRGYRVGEIAKIVNVMKGEDKSRTLQVTQRSEETLSYSNSASESKSSEQQKSDKFDVKMEAENVLRSQLEAKANADVRVSSGAAGGYQVQSSIGAGFAYATSVEESTKSAVSFARDVMEKAITAVERKTVQSRTISSTHETIETDVQKIVNSDKDAKHVSGIYRWLEKRYEAQLFNYGKRWMFEFVIPEPAAFLVESRLQALAKDMRLPQPPSAPDYAVVQVNHPGTNTPLQPSQISEEVFDALWTRYDLSDLHYPRDVLRVALVNQESGSNVFAQSDLPNDRFDAKTYHLALGDSVVGYQVTNITARGLINYRGRVGRGGGESRTDQHNDNRIVLTLNGNLVYEEADNALGGWAWQPKVLPASSAVVLTAPSALLVIGIQDGEYYDLMLDATLTRTQDCLERFQRTVFNRIRKIEEDRLAPRNEEKRVAYEAALGEYRDRLAELRALTVNELLQGRSEALNASVIKEELKRQCMSMISRELDWDASDDELQKLQPTRERDVAMTYPAFSAGEAAGAPYAKFDRSSFNMKFPFIDLVDARKQGRLTQFLEQAFEWGLISYLFYPYFWARQPKWVEMMNRLDFADSSMTGFLRAGSARVLVSVTPGYYGAVMHYLATREPWGGGPTPVIGDPLFIPVHEEIRAQQDDLRGATPEGKSWKFSVPTSLLYLQDSSSAIPADLTEPEDDEPEEPNSDPSVPALGH